MFTSFNGGFSNGGPHRYACPPLCLGTRVLSCPEFDCRGLPASWLSSANWKQRRLYKLPVIKTHCSANSLSSDPHLSFRGLRPLTSPEAQSLDPNGAWPQALNLPCPPVFEIVDPTPRRFFGRTVVVERWRSTLDGQWRRSSCWKRSRRRSSQDTRRWRSSAAERSAWPPPFPCWRSASAATWHCTTGQRTQSSARRWTCYMDSRSSVAECMSKLAVTSRSLRYTNTTYCFVLCNLVIYSRKPHFDTFAYISKGQSPAVRVSVTVEDHRSWPSSSRANNRYRN